ncbi:lysine histidine transporter 1 [Quillaja saponaria]|uniref:Lysine histidine transporter 1 n=1 Tax=Quillaja saponaria TaxID=32244 RepID=A0AAD7KTH4_QUISA|nr:lysine histidine transporter 1 [Quillaja saponaria]
MKKKWNNNCSKKKPLRRCKTAMTGFPSLNKEMQNGGFLLSAMSAMVGAGVLGFPFAMSHLGWGPGASVMVLSWVITLYTLWQMVEMHEMVPGKRFDRYHELGQQALGEKLGLWVVVSQQLMVEVGVNIVYMVTGGNVSLAAVVMSLSYSTIAWAPSLHKGVQPDVQYGHRSSSTVGNVFNFFSAVGDVAFALAGHNVSLEIQATIPSTPEKRPKKPIVEDNILISLQKPCWLIAAANLFVVIHVIGSYEVFAIPVYDMMESFLVRKMNFKPTRLLRFTTRNFYVALTMLLAITFPFFGGLPGFFGRFALATTSYFLPCIMWLDIYKPKKFSLSWCTNCICILVGCLLMTLAPIGALRAIILQAKDFKRVLNDLTKTTLLL